LLYESWQDYKKLTPIVNPKMVAVLTFLPDFSSEAREKLAADSDWYAKAKG
jgi:hypothetical protein